MAYYQLAPSFGSTDGRTLHPDSDYERQNPLMQPTAGFRYRAVDAPELVQNQLTGLLSGSSDYIRNARQRGQAFAASRGLMNSAGAAGSAEGAAIDAALPIAQQDAGWYGKTHADNMDAENRALLAKLDADTAVTTANISSGASMYNADKGLEGDRLRLDAQAKQSDLDRQYNRERDLQQHGWSVEDFNRANEAGRKQYMFQHLFGTVMDNPEVWRDPQAAMGMAQGYGQAFSSLWDSVFGGGQ